jgi:uncharacterized protein related to proFAR isomerase
MKWKGIYACPNCGGRDMEPLQLLRGPMATVDDWDGSYRCYECGHVAVPLFFESAEEWVLFRQSKTKNLPEQEEAGFTHIPIIPVDTRPLIGQTGFDIPFIKIVDVVTVEWDGKGFQRTAYSARFERYWRAISGTRYNCKQIMLMDLAGIAFGKPNFKAMRQLVKKNYEVWLDIGIASEQDLFDSFSLEAHKALADTSTVCTPQLFKDIYELSDRCIPCIHLADEVVWGKPQPRLKSLEATVQYLTDIGYKEIAVMDLKRLGKRSGVSTQLLERLQSIDASFSIGGGVLESDLERIKAAGMLAAFIEPFTPIISDLIDNGGDKIAADAPSSSLVARKSPKHLPTD